MAAHGNFSELERRLIETGEREALKEWVRSRLKESGWRDNLKEFCIEFIKSRGFDRLSTDEVIAALRPKGRQTVPEDVKAELLSRIRMFAEVQLGRVQQQGGGGAQTGNGGAAGEGVGAADGAQLKLSRSTT